MVCDFCVFMRFVCVIMCVSASACVSCVTFGSLFLFVIVLFCFLSVCLSVCFVAYFVMEERKKRY